MLCIKYYKLSYKLQLQWPAEQQSTVHGFTLYPLYSCVVNSGKLTFSSSLASIRHLLGLLCTLYITTEHCHGGFTMVWLQ